DQQNDRAYLYGKDEVVVHQCAKGMRVVEIGAHIGLWTKVVPEHDQHKRQFQHHDCANDGAHHHVRLKAATQTLHAHVKHHDDKQEKHHDGAHIHNDEEQT